MTTKHPQVIRSRSRVVREVGDSYLDMVEGRLVAQAAQQVHQDGGRFATWPEVTHTPVRFPKPEDQYRPVDFDMVPCDLTEADYVQVDLEAWVIPR